MVFILYVFENNYNEANNTLHSACIYYKAYRKCIKFNAVIVKVSIYGRYNNSKN